MQLTTLCTFCQKSIRTEVSESTTAVHCPSCDWSGPIAGLDIDQKVTRCLVCDCPDLWRQKDFPQRLGLLFVGMGALLSTIAWYYVMPATAICILLAFALVDFLLYAVMKDVLVCYRCTASVRDSAIEEDHPRFNLEVAERHRQEQIRLKKSMNQLP